MLQRVILKLRNCYGQSRQRVQTHIMWRKIEEEAIAHTHKRTVWDPMVTDKSGQR